MFVCRSCALVEEKESGVIEIRHTGQYGSRVSLLTSVPASASAISVANSELQVFYFEIEIVFTKAVAVAVGMAHSQLPQTSYPGWEPQSIGLHGDDGSVHNGPQTYPLSPTFSSGDVVGCGVLSDGRLFFTVNGRFQGVAKQDIALCESFGCVAMDGPSHLNAKVTSPSFEGQFEFDLSTLTSVLRQLPQDALVTHLTPETFSSFVNNPQPSVVEFYGPACAEAISRMYPNKIQTGAVDMGKHPELAQRYVGGRGVASGRAVAMFRDGDMLSSSLPSEVPLLSVYLRQIMSPLTVALASKEDFVHCLTTYATVVIGCFELPGQTLDSELWETFQNTSKRFADDIIEQRSMFSVSFQRRVVFASISSEEIAQSLGISTTPTVLLVKDGGRESDLFRGDVSDIDQLTEWINRNARVWVCALTKVSVKRIPAETDRVSCLLFVDPTHSDTQTLIRHIKEIASEEFASTVSFYTCDRSNEVAIDVRNRFGIGDSVTDVGLLRHGKLKFVGPNWKSGTLPTVNDIATLCRQCLADSLEVFLKSAPNSEGRQITTRQYDALVHSSQRPVAVLFFATWCQSSQNALREYANLAAVLQEQAPDFALFEFDVDANDPPLAIDMDRVPTVLFYPPADLSLPLVQLHHRFVRMGEKKDLANLVAFLKQHSPMLQNVHI